MQNSIGYINMKRINDCYIIAVSGGPDSMALFDMAVKCKLNLVCVHVNYQKRDTAMRDEMIVRDYCSKNNIPLYRLNAGKHQGNFQAWARDLRYNYIKEVANKYQTNKVLVAHQLDDYIETLIMQQRRGSMPFYFGIRQIMFEYDLMIIRPLLRWTKNELEAYCHRNAVKYGIDESNLANDYTRNILRHEIVEKMDKDAKLNLYYKIETLNHKRDCVLDYYRKNYAKNVYEIDELKKINNLDIFLRVKTYEDLGKEYLDEIKRQVFVSSAFKMQIRDIYVTKEYGKLYFSRLMQDYEVIVYDNCKLEHQCFKIVDNADSFHALTLKDEDYPLTIRNYQEGDKIRMHYGTKKISRFFIDHKIPSFMRKSWPVVLNAQKEIIFVPKMGCNVSHYSIKPNFFMIELLNTEVLSNA